MLKEIVVTKVPLFVCVCVNVAKVPRIRVSYHGSDDYLPSYLYINFFWCA
jgi:hypothetical protein